MRNPFRRKKREAELERFDENLWRRYCLLVIEQMENEKKLHGAAIRLSKKRTKKMPYVV